MVNTCWNAVDRHVLAGRGDQIAIMHESPITLSTKGLTYAQLQKRVASLAGSSSVAASRLRGRYRSKA